MVNTTARQGESVPRAAGEQGTKETLRYHNFVNYVFFVSLYSLNLRLKRFFRVQSRTKKLQN
jgi:hypothetical protein